MSAQDVIRSVANELEVQSLNSIVGGFAFAAALSWMDLVRFLVQAVVQVKNNGGAHYVLTALFTTLLSILVFMIIRTFNKKVERPEQPMYAITK